MFERPENIVPLETGNYLGELTNEIPEGWILVEVVVGGKKQYALKIMNLLTGEIKYIIKIRGVTLDSEAASKLNFETFKNLVLDFKETDYVDLSFNRILARRDATVVTKASKKRYTVVYRNGFIGEDGNTVFPHGYKKC